MDRFTQDAKEYVFDLLENDSASIWADIEATSNDTDADLWKKKLQKIASDHAFSSRFALMRILFSRSGGTSEEVGFEVPVQGQLCRFKDISLTHSKTMTPQEHLQYLSLLLELADRQTDSDPEINKKIICKAWLDTDSANALSEYLLPKEIQENPHQLKKERTAYQKKNKAAYKTLITRKEALMLGHILDFSLNEIQWYMLRVLDTEDGFRFNQSGDVIEAYGFLTGASWQHVQHLKDQYLILSSGINKTDNRERGREWTKNVADNLAEKMAQWNFYPETRDSAFLQWLQKLSPGLDLPSHTALRVYRNLAVFAYDLVIGEEYVPSEEEFLESIQDVCREANESGAVHRHLYQDGTVNTSLCKKIADTLLLENKIQSASIQADNAKAWHILTIRADKEVSSSGGMINISRTRVADILNGTMQPEKGDILYLLWFVSNLIWQGTNKPNPSIICVRVMDFMDAAKDVLQSALLPDFYPPHIMEQSMLLSIIYSGQNGEDPSVIYEYILYILTKQREKKQGSKRHTEKEKIEIVRFYREHSDLTLNECALHFHIAPQTLSAWQKQFLESGQI